MAVKVQHLRSSTASKRPTTTDLLAGEIAANINAGTPGLFIENSAGDGVIKIGPAEVGSSAPNSSPAAGGSTGNTTGEFWYDSSNTVLKIYNGTSFVVAGTTTIGTTAIDLGSTSTTLAGLTDVSTDVLTLPGATSGSIQLQAPATVTAGSYTFPADYGTSGQQLTTDGAGALTWSSADNDPTQIVDGDTSVVVDGTADTITFTTAGTSQWTINADGDFLPTNATQDIGSSGTPVQAGFFGNLTGTLQTASQTNVTGLGTITTGTWEAGIVGVTYGGTGLDGSSAADGTVLIGNGTGYTLATLTEGEGIDITNASGSITIAGEDATAGADAGSSNKGVASFYSSHFSVTNGFVELAGTAATSTFTTDSGDASPSTGTLNILGGTGLNTSGTGNTVTVNIDTQAGLTAASYGAADTVGTFTVDARGIVTAAADVTIDILHTQVSDFDAGVQTNRLDQMAAPTSSVDMNGQNLTGLADPVNAQDAATKNYVDSTAQGLDTKASVLAASTANLSADYSNGTSGVGATLTNNGAQAAFVLDGDTIAVGGRVLIKNQTAQAQNGIYEVTTAGDGATNWVLTRTTDFDEADEIPSGYTFVEGGDTNAANGYTCITEAPVTLGTTAIVFEQFSGAGQIEAGAGLTKSGNTLNVGGTADRITVNADTVDVASTYVGQTSITTLGTVTTGTWNADIIGLAYGGTGVDNTNRTASNAFLAPNGSDGNPTWRELLTTDIAPVTGGSFDAGTY